MKTAVKLILIDLLVAQIIAPILIGIPYTLYQILTTGTADQTAILADILIPAQLTGQLLMLAYLWKAGYISREKRTYSTVSVPFLLLSVVAVLSSAVVVSALADRMKWIPDIMEQSFDILRSGWGGILAIMLVGPLFEELLFRGAITGALLRQYRPATAILLSALFFGVFHINPAQMLPAFLIGLLLAWTYYKTGSLIPCMLMHVVNNSVALWLTMEYPDAKYMDEVIEPALYWSCVCVALPLLAGAVWMMKKAAPPKPSPAGRA